MNWIRIGVLATMLVAGCKTVVTTTTEIRPNRYAVVEFTRSASPDSIVKYAARAIQHERLQVQRVDEGNRIVTAGPVTFAAEGSQPALEATVTISAQPMGTETRVRIFASSMIEQNQIGGEDPRLVSLVRRVSQRMDTFIGP